MSKRILFTGGTGKAGRHVLPWLLGQGHQLLNFDLKPFDHPGIQRACKPVGGDHAAADAAL